MDNADKQEVIKFLDIAYSLNPQQLELLIKLLGDLKEME
jgi:hypothetical protein